MMGLPGASMWEGSIMFVYLSMSSFHFSKDTEGHTEKGSGVRPPTPSQVLIVNEGGGEGALPL